MLPGALLRNAGLRYICKQVYVRTETDRSPFTQALTPGQVLKIPIGHMEGNYFCEPDTLAELERSDRIAFRYCTQSGEVTSDANPNGSISCIAGVFSEEHNVLGMMPHPDRSSEAILGSSDGLLLFASLVSAMIR
jgi:phosphoribosylformylglycinamidine synthase